MNMIKKKHLRRNMSKKGANLAEPLFMCHSGGRIIMKVALYERQF